MPPTRRGADVQTRSAVTSFGGPATVAALALALALALDAPAVRMVAALAACLVLPGLGWARRLRLKDLGDTIALTVVLGLSLTAVVATGMAVTGTWSPVAGLAILAAVTVLGFVPVRAVVVRAGVLVFGRSGDEMERELVPVDLDDSEDGWTDWYADARARTDEERRRRAAEAEVAEQDWKDWYAESRLAAARERSVQWDAAPELSLDGDAAPEPGDWWDVADPAGEGQVGADPADVAPRPAELVTSEVTRD
ncbi:MAG TPA: hypothetical protein VIT65_06435 [Microlunatus sp.]